MALVLMAKRDLAAAEEDLRRAVAISSKYPSEIAETLTMTGNLGKVLADEGKDADAEAIFREVVIGRRKVLGEKHPFVARTMVDLATSLNNQGRSREAEALCRDALAIDKAGLPAAHPDTVLATTTLAGVLRDEGRFAESEAAFREALAADARTIGEHGNTATHCTALAEVLFQQGQNEEAGQLLDRAFAILRADGADGRVRAAHVLTIRGAVYRALARYDNAGRSLRQALEICDRNAGSQPEKAVALFEQAEVQRARKMSDAEALYENAIAIDRANSAAVRLALAIHLLGYAEFLARRDAPKAETAAREALAIETKYVAADSWQMDAANSVLAVTLAGQGRNEQAEALASAAYTNLCRKLGAHTRPAVSAAGRLAVARRMTVTSAQSPGSR
jgi:tetratricopeptide (TPR) repeat protein